LGVDHNYREDVSVWFRSILVFQPEPEHMATAPVVFQLHVIAGFVVFAVWPFTRLVHALSAPLQYVARPYVVYRTRDRHPTGARAPRRGWEPSRRDSTESLTTPGETCQPTLECPATTRARAVSTAKSSCPCSSPLIS